VSPGAKVKDILAGIGITFTLETSERALARRLETPEATSDEETGPLDEPSSSITGTLTLTPTPVPPRDHIYIPGIGPVDAKESALFYQNEGDEGQTFIALAFGRTGLAGVVDRLLSGDYSDCLLDEDREGDPRRVGLALCPASYEPQEESRVPESPPDGEAERVPAPEGAAGGLLIVSDDDGTGQYEQWTSAYDFADIATQTGHVLTLWSLSVEGELDLDRLLSFDAVIWCTGDYQKEGGTPDIEDISMLLAYLDRGGRLIVSGAFIGPPDAERGLVVDIQVVQAGHPVAEGFEAGQVIALERFTADEDYVMTVLSAPDPQVVVFGRGPGSELVGEPAIAVEEDTTAGSKAVWMDVPLYLLPAEARFQLATNAIEWILE
jgi:hypothetical protein